MLTTDRLVLVPLTRGLMTRRLAGPGFTIILPGAGEVYVGPQWPGDPLPVFPAWVAALPTEDATDDDAVDGTYVAVADGEAVGLLGTKGGVDPERGQEIGYGMNPSVWGRGYATEAVRALVAQLLTRPGIRAVTARTAVGNAPSQRVLDKLGFVRTGTAWDPEDGDLLRWRYRA